MKNLLNAGLKIERGCVADQPQPATLLREQMKFVARCGWSRTTQPRSVMVGTALAIFLLRPFAALAQAAINDLPALVPAYGEISPTFWEQNRTVVIIDVIVFLAVIVAVAWEIFKPKPALVLPPEKIAREALAKLQNQPEDGKVLSEVSQILRRYVGTVFGFPGGEMTTAEFCTAISRHEKIGTEFSGAIASFLRECDVRKFSPANSATPVNAVHRTLELVKNIHKHANTLNQGAAQP